MLVYILLAMLGYSLHMGTAYWVIFRFLVALKIIRILVRIFTDIG